MECTIITAFFVLLAVIAVGAQNATTVADETPTNDTTTGVLINETTANTDQPTTGAQIETASPPPGKTTPPPGKTTPPPATAPLTNADASTKPQQPTKPSPQSSSSGFNAASFIGGIVLGIAMTVILAFGYGFYKTRRDKNYHTL